jgi:putative ABC transport system ATP-binding protein
LSNIFTTSNISINGLNYKDLEFIEGKITFITGASGAGKTTLLRLFNGTVSPSSGEVYYLNNNISQLDTISLRQEVSLVSQELFLFDLSIKDNFREFYSYRGLPAPTQETMERFLRISCLNFPLDYNCSKMSGGEKQRVYIGIFLSLMPKVLLLDEPTSALDMQNGHNIFENIFQFCKLNNITVIVVSHDKILADKFLEEHIEIKKN